MSVRISHPPLLLRPLATLLCGFCTLPALAADDQTLDTVVVTASATEQTLRDAPASISVITSEEIAKRPVQELAELLGTVEGVTLSRNGNLVPGVQIRGLGQAYTLMLIDGKRVNSSNAVFRGNDYDTGWVPASEIERIEVVRGPMSSLYGSDAIGGVVNIITRKIGKTWRGSVKADAVVQEDADAGNAFITSASVSGPLIADVLGLRLSGGYDKREADDSNINDPGINGTQSGFPKVENRQFSGALNWRPVDGHEVGLTYDRNRRNHDGFILEREASSLSHSGRYGFGTSDITFNYDETRNQTGTVTGQKNPNKATSLSLDGKLVLPWEAASQLLTLGGELRRENLRDRANLAGLPGTAGYGTDPEAEVSQYALFIEDEFTLRDDLKLTLGNRFDHHENFGGHNSPRAYVVYHATESVSFKAGWARAFRAPTLLQGSPNWGSVSCGSAVTGCYIIGSEDIKPETSTSKELGVQFDFGKVGGGITLFHNKIKDMIDITNRTSNVALAPTYANFVGYLPDGRPIFAYQNINSVTTKGVETSFRAELSPQWSMRANYTYTDAKNTSGVRDIPMVYRPRHSANLGADWKPGDRWSLNATARYSGSQYISVSSNGQNRVKKSAYGVVDLSAAYRINKMLTVRAGVLNLGDEGENRDVSTDFNEEGRRYFVSLAADF